MSKVAEAIVMSPLERSNVIKAAALEAGFDRCGIAPASTIPRADFFRQWLDDGNAGSMAYLHRHVKSRIDLRTWLPAAKSVIVVALNYKQPEPPIPDDQPRGRVAMYAWGDDYHVVLQDKLEALVGKMRTQLCEPFEAKICVDTSAIIERELAAMAGVGWIGKNTLVMHQSLGSHFFLGEIITDLVLAPDAAEPDHCGTCTRCLDACPTQAFPQPYVMDARRCISYLTIEHRSEIDPDLGEKMGDWVFGCDICQQVCPHNSHAPDSTEVRFSTESDVAHPVLDDILGWDEATYARRVTGRATDRARLAMWKRNAQIAFRNIAAGSPVKTIRPEST